MANAHTAFLLCGAEFSKWYGGEISHSNMFLELGEQRRFYQNIPIHTYMMLSLHGFVDIFCMESTY